MSVLGMIFLFLFKSVYSKTDSEREPVFKILLFTVSTVFFTF